ncbi:hypothetical protein G647_04414 [Cladophialophora carrionii CBS 160.54]|uniref:Frequency clock protein n=1 Tax=Cladophialophora carrionii CBS 160.54 TaxID=1279043 RepID=V9DDR5_9EURO|nr:uncharacterized protein G647_04414 [Cladophialophora carrionii CBS 160.54]ETI25044.1 hypothetical protein G647_04414 [Cladophialophora carrionii CBS 160.54]
MLNSKITSTTSPKRPFSAISTSHPRRSNPSQSKSLPKHKKVKIEQNSDGSGARTLSREGQTSPNLPLGESRDSSSDQSAAKWFASKNENVADSQDKIDTNESTTESPFYLARQSSSHPPNNLRSHNGESFGPKARDDTENDELRGVIDDLTVENKKLKTVLRSWHSRTSPPSSNPDRVFEVRMHGLPAEKKRELEDILMKFATRLGDSPSHQSSSVPVEKSTSSAGYATEAPQKAHQDPTPADSGYASVSMSGGNSISQVGGLKFGDRTPVSKSKKDTDIQNYLYDIPDSLLPRETVSVSENAKMQMVVQRLEHLFTGKRAAPGEHSLPLQQQQISRSAAKADRREDRRLNRASKTEGLREAHILPPDTKINLDAVEAGGQRSTDPTAIETPERPASPDQRPASPDQRPTRPLDLDIQRAQVASDNIDYLRHLGLSSPHFEDDTEAKDQPWMYLNLLVSMAQLHTFNVTPAFVRKAVKQLSTKFELSKDGHKIRWRGGAAGAASSSQESPESVPHRASDDTGDDGGRRSGRSTASTTNNLSVSVSDHRVPQTKSSTASKMLNSTTNSSNPANVQTSTTMSKSTPTSAFNYKPVVFQQRRPLLKARESYLDSSSSYDGLSPDSSGIAHALGRSSLKANEDAYEGYITFFSNPYFFTDLSGDKSPIAEKGSTHKMFSDALGIVRKEGPVVDDALRDARACYFLSPRPSKRTSWPSNIPDVEMPVTPITSAGEYETQPMELEASGVGGVRPEDNFAIDVRIARIRNLDGSGGGKGKKGDRPAARYEYRVAECSTLTLQPSRLPPPSYVFFMTSSSSEAEKGNLYDDDDSEELSEEESSPAPAGFLWQWSSSSNDRPGGDDDASEASSSLGVLEAARARVLPGTANETRGATSGSLAATAGASWSAASNAADADLDIAQDLDDTSVDSMLVD